MKSKDKLRVTYCKKEQTFLCHYPLGVQTKRDAGYLSGIFHESVKKELTNRGYDINTLKFEISPSIGDKRFASQRNE